MPLQFSLHSVTVEQGGRVTIGGSFDIEVFGKTEPGTYVARIRSIQALFDDPFFPLGPCLVSISTVAAGGLAWSDQLQVRAEGGIPAGGIGGRYRWSPQKACQGEGSGDVAESHERGSTFRQEVASYRGVGGKGRPYPQGWAPGVVPLVATRAPVSEALPPPLDKRRTVVPYQHPAATLGTNMPAPSGSYR